MLLLAACGGSRIVDPCAGVTCRGEGLQLDTATCTCACGDPLLGQKCAHGEVCKPTGGGFQCASTRCEGVTCDRSTYCDASDGRCVCGENREVCGADEYCTVSGCTRDSLCSGVSCDGRGDCDPADGRCKCNGQVCTQDQSCLGDPGAEQCLHDGCRSVTCTSGEVCSRSDLLCHCGDPDGPVCTSDQACVDGSCGA